MNLPLDMEAWLRGPIEGVPPLLQPVAHALVHAREDARHELMAFPPHLLWERPGDVASVGFHLQHARGVIDRLFTYARGEKLSIEQREQMKGEGKPVNDTSSVDTLLEALHAQVDRAIQQLKHTPEHSLIERRLVGRQEIPSTVVGLLFHAAEHTQRHIGQMLVTARVLINTSSRIRLA